MIKRILVPTDGSTGAMAAAQYAASLAEQFAARATIIHVIDVPRVPDYHFQMKREEIRKEFIEGGRAMLGMAQKVFAQAGIPIETELREGDPAEVIRDVALEGKYDLIVIGSRGAGTVERLLLGSVSEKVVRGAPCPVLVVRDMPSPMQK